MMNLEEYIKSMKCVGNNSKVKEAATAIAVKMATELKSRTQPPNDSKKAPLDQQHAIFKDRRQERSEERVSPVAVDGVPDPAGQEQGNGYRTLP